MPVNPVVIPVSFGNGTTNLSVSSTSVPTNVGTIKPILTKTSAIDVCDEEAKKLSRGISRTAENACVISQIRNELCASLSEVEEPSSLSSQFNALETNDCTFTLPDLSTQSDEFRAFLENELIDTSMAVSLQEAVRLNWWTCLGEGCEKLWPLSTTGDGNCLLHAASLGMWGFHDRLLILRKALYNFLTMGTCRHALWRRWRWQNARSNLQAGLDLRLNEDEWRREWDNILKLASSQPRTSGSSTPSASETEVDGRGESFSTSKTYESLEEIHVLALAHVLKRPIFVIADTVLKDVNGEALAPIPFGGIYLPLEIEPSECSRSPLILAYDAAHFSALVAMTPQKKFSPTTCEQALDPPAVIPLVDVDRELLPIQFEVDPGEGCVWNRDEFNEAVVQRVAFTHEDRLALLNQFLDLVDILCPAVIKNTSSKTPKVKNDTKTNGTLSRPAYDTEGWNSDGEFNGRLGPPGYKAPGKQLHSVAKQFGSLGRSVGRKIRRNLIDNFTVKHPQPSSARLNNVQWECPDFILCARLHTEKHHPCLEQMIANYLQSARQRFEQQQAERQRQTLVWQRRKQHTLAEMAIQEGPSPCINPNCSMFGTALTSYMCTACYAKQLEQEEERAKNLKVATNKSTNGNQNALYGIGKSVFYAQSDSQSYADASSIPARRPPSGQNGTLYLSNSTFYGDAVSSSSTSPSPKKEEKIVFEKISPSICDKFKHSIPNVLEPVGQTTTQSLQTVTKVNDRNGSIKLTKEIMDLGPNHPEEQERQSQPIRPPRAQPSNIKSRGNSLVDAEAPRASPAVEKVAQQPTSRLLSHYESIRKPCKSTGCTSYGLANTQWFCADCFFIRKKAALDRESILEDLKAAQMQ